MPYRVNGKCVYKKDGGAKVGCTKGSVNKYLAALHANANESVEPITEAISETDFLSLPKAICTFEPRGDKGLEGFDRGTEYRYQALKTNENKDYIRVYHDNTYYETCGVNTFKKYFKTETTQLAEANEIKGGKADNMCIKDIAKKFKVAISKIEAEMKKGKKVEHEHTNSDSKATEIAMDHLVEFPDYYTRLEKMEKEAEKHWKSKKVNENTKELIKRLIRENLDKNAAIEMFSASISSTVRNNILKQGFTRTLQRRSENRFINEYKNGLGTSILTQVVWSNDNVDVFFKLSSDKIGHMTQQETERLNNSYSEFLKKTMSSINQSIQQGEYSHLKHSFPLEYHIMKI
jgi:hypothetical protein